MKQIVRLWKDSQSIIMEDQKTEIVEKRLNKGVIRRRARNVVEPKKEAAASEQKISKAKSEAPVSLAKPLVEQPLKKDPVEEVVLQQEVVQKKDESRLVLSDHQKASAAVHLEKNLKKTEKIETKVEADTSVPAPVIETVTIKEDQPKPAPKEERKKVLSFKDRVKGTISLDRLKPAEAPEAAPAPKRGLSKSELEAEEKKERAAKARRVKEKGGDLDIDGLGRATNLAELVRTAPIDRVFRPGLGRAGRSRKKKIVSKKNIKSTSLTERKASKRVIAIDQKITVGNLAQELGVKAGEIIKHLMDLGTMATINQEIEKETAKLIAAEYKYEVKDISFKEDAVLGVSEQTQEGVEGEQRPPVVTVMGHVDHGKTSLLDAIRSTKVTDGEAGGITQHIGAYTVELSQGKITFLDTPGHEAFTTMRSRGANVTDIVVLVVAADDGVMPQTLESINHAKVAGVPIIVAVNKIDKPGADVDKIKRQLSEKGLLAEDWGGETIFCGVSAKEKQGIDELLESILLQAEMLELRASSATRAHGVVIEAKLDRGRGPVCSLLVQGGVLKVGDPIVAGEFYGKIRALYDWQGTLIDQAGPSMAVEVLGFSGIPEAGDNFNVADSDQDAARVAENRAAERQRKSLDSQTKITLEDMFSKMKAGDITKLNLILKADTQGSLEALKEAIAKIGNEEVTSNIIHLGVGGINESDVTLARTSQAVIIGFNVRPETNAIHLAKESGVDVKLYKVIYNLVNDVKLALQGLLAPDVVEEYLGRAEVRQAFEISKHGMIAGSMVIDGVITRTAKLRLLRDNVVIFEGQIESLKRFKDDAKDVKQGFECGIGIQGCQDIKENDVIEAYNLKEIQKTL